MVRPCLCRKINYKHKETIFKPKGIRVCDCEIIELTTEEQEALRLKNIQDLDQNECAETMNTSQSTFQRILKSAHKKISLALIEGKVIKMNK